MTHHPPVLLAGDIGGTKTALALYAVEHGPRQPLTQATFPSQNYASLESIVREFLADRAVRVTRASFGVAGPVDNGRAQVTNLPWIVEAQALSAVLEAPVVLLNDLAAIAHAIPYLKDADLETLNAGQVDPHGALAIVAPGTGLGEAFLVWDGQRYRPFPSEGGHADFSPTTPLQVELLIYLQARFDHVSYERVCSGKGLPNLYAFLKDTDRYSEPKWLHDDLARAADLTPVIVQAALDQRAEISVATMDLFVSILGSEAGNLALKVLATGGLYLGGGIPPRILSLLTPAAFLSAFTRKGRFADVLARVPIHVIRQPQVALFGAACHGLEAETQRD